MISTRVKTTPNREITGDKLILDDGRYVCKLLVVSETAVRNEC